MLAGPDGRATSNPIYHRLDDLTVSGTCSPSAPPVANAGPELSLECVSPSSTLVTLDGSGSFDPDGDVLSYTWSGPFGTASGPSPTVALPLGASTISLVVNDGQVDSAPDTATITVTVRPEGLQLPLAGLVPEGNSIPLPDKAFKQGSTLPLKLRLFCGGLAVSGADVSAPRIVALVRSGEPINIETTDLDAGQADDNSLLFRSSEGNWGYNLSTRELSTGSYVITIQMPDGRRFSGAFDLR